MTDRVRFWALMLVGVITGLDIVAVATVRIFAHSTPTTAGDVAKVGIGILGGAVMMSGKENP